MKRARETSPEAPPVGEEGSTAGYKHRSHLYLYPCTTSQPTAPDSKIAPNNQRRVEIRNKDDIIVTDERSDEATSKCSRVFREDHHGKADNLGNYKDQSSAHPQAGLQGTKSPHIVANTARTAGGDDDGEDEPFRYPLDCGVVEIKQCLHTSEVGP